MTTFAEMTIEQQEACRGMWFDTVFGLAILTVLKESKDGDEYGLFIRPEGLWHTEGIESVTPRFDLPRAWSPDGKPVAGEWKEEITDLAGTLVVDGTITEVTPYGHTLVRRFITEWEEMP